MDWNPAEQATRFLDRLFVGTQGFIDVKALRPDRKGDAGRRFFDVRWPADAVEYALAINQTGWSVYCGVNPRHTRGGTEADVAYVRALFLDLDANKGVDIGRNIEKLRRFDLDPSMIVISGNGAHAYLILDTPVPCSEGKLIAERLCDATDSDRVFNVNRIARIPGTLNWKDETPKPCYLWSVTDKNYSLSDVASALDRMGVPRVVAKPDAAPTMQNEDSLFSWSEFLRKLSPQTVDLIKFGVKHDSHISRSESDYQVVLELVKSGATNEQVQWIYTNTEIGTLKYKEMGHRYLNQTIKKARHEASGPVKLRKPSMPKTRFGRSCRTAPLRATW